MIGGGWRWFRQSGAWYLFHFLHPFLCLGRPEVVLAICQTYIETSVSCQGQTIAKGSSDAEDSVTAIAPLMRTRPGNADLEMEVCPW